MHEQVSYNSVPRKDHVGLGGCGGGVVGVGYEFKRRTSERATERARNECDTAAAAADERER